MRSSDLPVEQASIAPEDVPLSEVRRAVDELFTLARTSGDTRSALSGQINALRLGIASGGDEYLWRRTQQADERQARYATLLIVWNRLTPLQQRVLMAQRTPCSSIQRIVQIRTGDLVAWTRRGAEVIGRKRKEEEHTVVADDGCLFVSQSVPVYPARGQVAEQLGVSTDQVRRAASAAYDVWRRFLSASE
jgi:hypothetical protein